MIEKLLEEKNRILVAITLIIFGIIGRLSFYKFLPSTPPIYFTLNGITQPLFMMDLFFVIAIVSLLSGLLLGGYYTFMVPVATIMITDIIIGNTYIFLFTWSGFILISVIAYSAKNRYELKTRSIPIIAGMGILSILAYDIWTNFGCWLGWYPHTFNALIVCYTVAIPFMLWHLLSTTLTLTIILVPIVYLKEHYSLQTIVFTNKSPLRKIVTVTVPSVLMTLVVSLFI